MKQRFFFLCFLVATTIAASVSDENIVTSAIDSSYRTLWAEKGLTPTPVSSDEEFVRRIYLDLTGRIPRARQTLAFLTSTNPRKRETLIDSLLAGEDFAEYQARLWTNLFIGHQRERFVNREAFTKWFQAKLEKNAGWDEIAREIITAEGSLADNPPLNWYVKRKTDAANLADDTAQLFLGLQVGCARCHNHPHDQWKMEDFYGLAAFFNGIDRDRQGQYGRRKFRQLKQKREEMQKKKAEGEQPDRSEMAEMLQEAGELLRLRHEPTGEITAEVAGGRKSYPAKFLTMPVSAHSVSGTRDELARWITAKDNPYFAKAFVNRVWAQMMGVGFVNPVDDMSEINKPSNPELLNYLTNDFRASGYDIKRLISAVAHSRTYQLSSKGGKRSPYLESGKVVPLNADQLMNSFLISTSLEAPLKRLSPDEYEQKMDTIYRYHVFLFDNDENQRNNATYEGTVPQALFLLNGKMTNEAVRPHMTNTISNVLRTFQSSGERIDGLFLCALSRYPLATEKEKLIAYIKAAEEETEAYEDILWALLNSSEFLFNH